MDEISTKNIPLFETFGENDPDTAGNVCPDPVLEDEIPESIMNELVRGIVPAVPMEDGWRSGEIRDEIRLESKRTSLFLHSLASALENFLDILGEPFEFSAEKNRDPAHSAIKRPKTFQGPGFCVTFPFHGAVGLFLIAEHGEILPPWAANPGIAGKSRILLLANELEHLFSIDEKNESELAARLRDLEADESEIRQDGTFYGTDEFFYGKIESLERLFDSLAAAERLVFRSFSIRKFNGHEGSAWMLAPVEDLSVLYQNRVKEEAAVLLSAY